MKKGRASELSTAKSRLRTHFRELFRERHSLSESSIKISEQKLVQNILHFLESNSGIWGAYKALPSEASVDEVSAAKSDITWVYPKMSGASLVFVQPTQWQQDSRFGVLEPVLSKDSGKLVALDKIQGLLVPGLAFDRLGNRLGRGKGFYDQTLSSFNGIKVGIGFSWQLSPESIPTESHDVKVNWIITEDSILKC